MTVPKIHNDIYLLWLCVSLPPAPKCRFVWGTKRWVLSRGGQGEASFPHHQRVLLFFFLAGLLLLLALPLLWGEFHPRQPLLSPHRGQGRAVRVSWRDRGTKGPSCCRGTRAPPAGGALARLRAWSVSCQSPPGHRPASPGPRRAGAGPPTGPG